MSSWTSLFSWDAAEKSLSGDAASYCPQRLAFQPTKLLLSLSLRINKKKKKEKKTTSAGTLIALPLALSLRLTVLVTVPPGNNLEVPCIGLPNPRGRQSSSVSLNLFNVELSSELIHVFPHATQPRPQRLIVLPIGLCCRHITVVGGAPVHLLDGGVWRHVPGDLALFGPRLHILHSVLVCRRAVRAAPIRAPEEALVRLAAVLACYSEAAEAVEIPKFL